jgi:hypothetical protein
MSNTVTTPVRLVQIGVRVSVYPWVVLAQGSGSARSGAAEVAVRYLVSRVRGSENMRMVRTATCTLHRC